MAQMVMAMWQQTGSGGINPDVAKKITGEHITQALKNADTAHERYSGDRKDARSKWVAVFVISVAATLGLVGMMLWTGNAALLEAHFDALAALFAGGFGGYGFGRRLADQGSA